MDVLLDFLNVLGHLAEVLFFQVVSRLWGLFGCRENVLNCVGNDEILVALEAMDMSLIGTGDWLFLVRAVIRKLVG